MFKDLAYVMGIGSLPTHEEMKYTLNTYEGMVEGDGCFIPNIHVFINIVPNKISFISVPAKTFFIKLLDIL